MRPLIKNNANHALRQGKTSSSCGILDTKSCQTIEEVIQMASEHEHLSPSNPSAFLSRIPQMITPNICRAKFGCSHEQQDLKHQPTNILTLTIKSIGNFGPRDIAETVLALPKLLKMTLGSILAGGQATTSQCLQSFSLAKHRRKYYTYSNALPLLQPK